MVRTAFDGSRSLPLTLNEGVWIADIGRRGSSSKSTHTGHSARLSEVAHLVMDAVVSLPTLDDLRRHVMHTLCQHDKLDPEQTPMFQGKIERSGRACGLFFQVQGPRLLK